MAFYMQLVNSNFPHGRFYINIQDRLIFETIYLTILSVVASYALMVV